MMKRGYYAIYHRMSPKHLDRYVEEFSGRHNIVRQDTINQMEFVARGLLGKLLRYRELIRAQRAAIWDSGACLRPRGDQCHSTVQTRREPTNSQFASSQSCR